MFKVSSHTNLLLSDAKVTELINQNSGTWKTDFVKQMFWLDEADTILNISLRKNYSRDIWVWHSTKNGQFSVKSAYKVAEDLILQTSWIEWRIGRIGKFGGESSLEKIIVSCYSQ
ncbi:hypothetical protein ACH5RR_006757 [Cinchona calisaya]|uniref:Uncharacterized protein n=1 Tax=Cinchona calisaya TaxID=153742 RepID=A0ABD3APW7_9GENT